MTAPTTAQQGLTAVQVAALIELVRAQAAVRGQLADTAVAAAVAAFNAVTDWWGGGDITQAITTTTLIVGAAQRNAARVTDAYLARAMTVMRGRRVPPAGVVDVANLRRAITPDLARELTEGRLRPGFGVIGDTRTVGGGGRRVRMNLPPVTEANRLTPGVQYGRVADNYRYQVVVNGLTEEAAKQRALVRIGAVAHTDVTLAVRAQWAKALDKRAGVTGYRRIVNTQHPVPTKTGPCGLCVVAADRIYKVEELLPLHPGCACTVLPVLDGMDPGLSLNGDDLRALYNAAGGTTGHGVLSKIRVALAEHGETGPTLVDADQHFRGPTLVAKTASPDPRVRAQAQLASLRKSLVGLQRRQAAGEDVARPLRWQVRKINQLTQQLQEAA